MKVAVFYTGCLRTFEKTAPHNLQNLFNQKDKDVKVNIFACIQNDTSRTEEEIGEQLIKLFTDCRGNTLLRSIKWFNNNDNKFQEWKNTRVDNLNEMEVSQTWKNYLKSSGSITEYVQYSHCWRQMEDYENITGDNYDYVVRLRTDIVIATPLDFSTLPSTEKTQQGLMDWLSKERRQQGVFDEIIESIPEIEEMRNPDKWLLSIRKNLLYIMPRITAEIVSNLSDLYGFIKPATTRQQVNYPIWMDAESQLQLICLQNGVSIFDSTTSLEGKSVYEFKKNIYFDFNEKDEWLISNPQYAAFAYR